MLFMFFRKYWEELGFGVIIIGAFFCGYHYRTLVDLAKEEKQSRVDIIAATTKLLDDQKIDNNYNKQINIIDTAADNQKIEVTHEKNDNCLIPAEWLRIIKASSRN